jgi:hypothetical protein
VNNYWTKFFRDESENRSTLQFMNFKLQLEGLQLADEWRKEQSFVTVIEICIGSCYGTFLAG